MTTRPELEQLVERTGKALSIMQPWAWLIVNGHKDIENRDWPTRFRGPILIHAGKRLDADSEVPPSLNPPTEFERGGIVGIAEIVDCIEQSESPWFCGRYGFVLRNTRPLPFIPMRGQLGIFDITRTLRNDDKERGGS